MQMSFFFIQEIKNIIIEYESVNSLNHMIPEWKGTKLQGIKL